MNWLPEVTSRLLSILGVGLLALSLASVPQSGVFAQSSQQGCNVNVNCASGVCYQDSLTSCLSVGDYCNRSTYPAQCGGCSQCSTIPPCGCS